MDDVFIDALVAYQHAAPQLENHLPTVGAVCAAQRAVNSRFGKRLSYRYCVERLSHLRKRHTTFAWLIRREGVFWLARWKQVWAPDYVWDKVGRFVDVDVSTYVESVTSCKQEQPFALAYRWKPELKWNDLKIIFGCPDNDNETLSDENVETESDSSDADVELDSVSSSQATIVSVSDYDNEVSSASSVPKSE
ncbi:hypothetical protein Salat_2608900 [Sesamum alatum]|uniref:Myb/SANT-like domain-containing protein n=1 Tax=Sesamum alatum TaxID=300844 RepID=A0AAE1XPA9_9LAMI|nr:hypothetical protein Salat_2608900 [Sesamum alatum]